MDEIEIALEDCLQQITTGRSSVGQCLSRYPRYAAELRPMLEAAVRLRDVADVVIGAEPRQGAVTRDAKGEAVAGMVIMLKGENSKDVVTRVKDAIGKAQGVLPPGARIAVFYDRTSLIEASIKTVTDALLEGGLFVILVLFLFVAELRTALVVLFSLPFTFLVSFILMGRLGLTSNLMSLGGLAFSVGMVVDASIVVVENIRRHLAHRVDQQEKRRIVAEAIANSHLSGDGAGDQAGFARPRAFPPDADGKRRTSIQNVQTAHHGS